MTRLSDTIKRTVSGLLCAALAVFSCGCSGSLAEEMSADAPPDSLPAISSEVSSTAPSAVSSSASSDNTSLSPESIPTASSLPEPVTVPIATDSDWTIFVYMSGSTLESANGKGTEDMSEMLAGTSGDKVRFVIQTGGSKTWEDEFVSADKLCRFEISDGKRTKLSELPSASMADPETLRDFLEWGLKSYPAEKMGVVFWGHGKGSVGGVCCDDLYDMDFLPLTGIRSAFSDVYGNMSDKLEFVGFDACYMGTIEAADILAPYSRYMIGSQELEAASGWNYTKLASLLCNDPDAGWEDIAKAICDGFFDDSEEYASRSAIAVTDLSKTEGIVKMFDELSQKLYAAASDRQRMEEFESRLDCTEHFSDATYYDGYSNLADLAGFAECVGLSGGEELIKAIDDAVIYKRRGKKHKNACGLTVYYPFAPDGAEQLMTFSEVAVSPSYLAFVDKRLRANSPVYDLSDYDPAEIMRLWNERSNGADIRGYWKSPTDGSGLVRFEKEIEPGLDGTYSMKIAPETLDKTASAELTLYMVRDDGRCRSYGKRPCADADWKTGEFSDMFDCKWLLLSDGTPVGLKRLGLGKDIFGSPASLDAGFNVTAMKLKVNESMTDAEILGLWLPQSDGKNGLVKPQEGDVLTTCYAVADTSGREFAIIDVGESEYTLTSEPVFTYGTLPDGEYFYTVTVTDIYNEVTRSDKAVSFELKQGVPVNIKYISL